MKARYLLPSFFRRGRKVSRLVLLLSTALIFWCSFSFETSFDHSNNERMVGGLEGFWLPAAEVLGVFDATSKAAPVKVKPMQPPPPWVPSNRLPYYGGLKYKEQSPSTRSTVRIHEHDRLRYEDQRRQLLMVVDLDNEEYHYKPEFHDLEQDVATVCRDPNWAHIPHPTCHDFHEISMLDNLLVLVDGEESLKHLAEGTYRSTFLYRNPHNNNERVIFKPLRLVENSLLAFDAKSFYQTLTDVTVMDVLTVSPHIVDVFGFCGTSVMTEALQDTVHTQIFNRKVDHHATNFDASTSHNNLTLSLKLDWAIQFGESVAELHGYAGGPMMHGDFHSPQWLQVPGSTRIKLNDFNKGHIFRWHGEKQRYCATRRSYGGTYRAPEDMRGVLNGSEKSDTYTLGNHMYGLLTGMKPFYEYKSSQKTEDLMKLVGKEGRRPYLHPAFSGRTIIEDALIHAMNMAWEFNPKERASVFEILQYLYSVRDELQSHAEEKHTS